MPLPLLLQLSAKIDVRMTATPKQGDGGFGEKKEHCDRKVGDRASAAGRVQNCRDTIRTMHVRALLACVLSNADAKNEN